MPRKTITVSEYLDERIARMASERGASYNATVVSLIEEAMPAEPLPYAGIGEGPGDLSVRNEEYLDEIAAGLWDDHRHRPVDRSA